MWTYMVTMAHVKIVARDKSGYSYRVTIYNAIVIIKYQLLFNTISVLTA